MHALNAAIGYASVFDSAVAIVLLTLYLLPFHSAGPHTTTAPIWSMSGSYFKNILLSKSVLEVALSSQLCVHFSM